GEIELAADYVVPRARIAANVDALDVGARALLDHERDVDDAGLEVAVATRAHLREGIATLRHLDRDVLHGLFHLFGVVDGAGAHAQAGAHSIGRDVAHVGDDVDGAEAVEVAFFDLVGDHEAAPQRIVFGDRRHDADVGIAVLEIEPAQQLA